MRPFLWRASRRSWSSDKTWCCRHGMGSTQRMGTRPRDPAAKKRALGERQAGCKMVARHRVKIFLEGKFKRRLFDMFTGRKLAPNHSKPPKQRTTPMLLQTFTEYGPESHISLLAQKLRRFKPRGCFFWYQALGPLKNPGFNKPPLHGVGGVAQLPTFDCSLGTAFLA